MEIFLEALAIVLGVVGLLGCVLPVIPGPPLGYLGLVIIYFCLDGGDVAVDGGMSSNFMLLWLAVTIVVTILDYIVPLFFTKVTGGSKVAVRASVAGMLVGMIFFPPLGIIAGPFIGALLGELLIEGKGLGASFLSALGSFIGFIFGTGLKLAASGMMIYYIILYI